MAELGIVVPAAQYVRVSTERQEYSLECQFAGISQYAQQNGFTVCQTYCDEAKSGLVITHRSGLSKLLQDVATRNHSYRAILVYDVSRWGRFQDPDEAAHYEFICKAAGVPVHYCAEHFANDRQLPNLILKTLKRVMAAEYSRELSDKVFAGLTRLAKDGFRTGSYPGYGLRRMLVGADRTPKQQLANGEQKNIKTDRVILVPGPAQEVFWVREIYRMFILEGMTFTAIARALDQKHIPFSDGKGWSDYAIKKILTHPKYKGTAVYNRTSERLRSKSMHVPESEWILTPNAFEPLVTAETFDTAQEVLRNKVWHRTNQQVLDALKSILQKHGYLSSALIYETRGNLTPAGFIHRFGSLIKAYELIGYQTPYSKMARHRLDVYRVRRELMEQLTQKFPGKISVCHPGGSRLDCLKLRNGTRISVRACRSLNMASRGRVWALQKANGIHCRITLLAALNPENTAFEKFYLLPRIQNRQRIHLSPAGKWEGKGASLANLDAFYETVKTMKAVPATYFAVDER